MRIVLNSKAEPSLEVELKGAGWKVRASSPSGTSAGSHEARAWPEANTVDEAVRISANKLRRDVFPEIIGKDIEPEDVDELLEEVDGTPRLERLGGNAALALSIASVKAFAWEQGVTYFEAVAEISGFEPKPVKPLENFIGGGAHGGASDIQEYLVAVDTEDMRENVLCLSWAYRETKSLLKERDPWFDGALTLESAYVSRLKTDGIFEVLESIREASEGAGYRLFLGVDVAANELWDGEKYIWKKEGKELSPEEHYEFLSTLSKRYGLAYIEDPFHEDAFDDFRNLQEEVGATVVGDDLFATNHERVGRGKGIRGALIKLNQAGTVSRTVEAIKTARNEDMSIITSHRSGETDDSFLAHFSVGVGADFAKIGAAGIRTVKLNEIIRIGEFFSP